jgi:hypothetical protein
MSSIPFVVRLHGDLPGKRRPELSLVVPVYNEGPAVDQFLQRVVPFLERLQVGYELLFVDDGSSDDTLARLVRHRRENRAVRILSLSRNFGKEAATTAGLDYARGAAVVPIDCDLQDPPELIEPMLARWREGFDVVNAIRSTRQGERWSKRWTAAAFYRLFNLIARHPIPVDTGDFRLLDRKVVRAIRQLPERTRFMKGIFAWVGFKQATVYYRREPRSFGSTKWNFTRLLHLAIEGIVSFSTLPLRIWTPVGLACLAVCGLLAVFQASGCLAALGFAGGWSTLVSLGVAGVQLVALGVMGEYLARIMEEIKSRPIYVVSRRYGLRAKQRRRRQTSIPFAEQPAAEPRAAQPPAAA